jgi:hypothetical protein
MLDPCFKSLQIVENYVGFGATIRLASKYDSKIVIPLLMACFDPLNPSSQDVRLLLMCSILNLKKKKVICLVLEHPWKNPLMILLLERTFKKFKRLFIPASTCVDLLSWWQ